jgi:hypothetical protein
MSRSYDARFVVRCEKKVFAIRTLHKTRVMDKEERAFDGEGVGEKAFHRRRPKNQTSASSENEKTLAHLVNAGDLWKFPSFL